MSCEVTESRTKEDMMATMITGDRIAEAVKSETFIQGGILTGVEGLKYDFRLSNDILKAKFKRPIDASEILPKNWTGV
jgi:hypothetical protein